MRFVAHSKDIYDVLRCNRDWSAFSAIERFELPAAFDDYDKYMHRYPLVSACSPVELPSLRTIIFHSGGSYAEPFWILRPGVLGGAIFAPALTRIEITKSPDAPASSIDAYRIVHFISDVLEVGDRRALEVFVDTASGLHLEGDVNKLLF